MAKQIGWSQESNLLYQISALITRLTQVTAANGGGGGSFVPYTGAIGSVNLGNNNLSATNVFTGFSSIAASGTQVVLTVNSAPEMVVTGSGGQTIKLPNATTLQNGTTYRFNNNQSSGAILVNNNSDTLVVSIPSGGYVDLILISNTIAAGTWDRHDLAPANVSWSTNTFDYPGSITSATWNGSVVAINRGGTGSATQNFVDLTTTQTIAGDKTFTGVLRETITTNRQTSSYTFVLADRGKLVEMNVATANNLSVPLNSNVAFAIGTRIDVVQYGAGQTTILATSGVTIRSASNNLKIASQYVAVSLVKIGADEWYCFGNLTA